MFNIQTKKRCSSRRLYVASAKAEGEGLRRRCILEFCYDVKLAAIFTDDDKATVDEILFAIREDYSRYVTPRAYFSDVVSDLVIIDEVAA